MKFKIKFADQIVGLFIIVALAFFAVIVVLIGANQRWFAKDYRFVTSFPSAAGVAPGTSILMKGFTIGKIDKLRLNADNAVDADFHIYDTYYDKVREYSILELTVSPIGLGSQLLFHPGTGEARLEEGAFVPTADSIQGQSLIDQELVVIPPKDDTITRLLANVNPLLENTNKTIVTVNRTLTEVNRALAGQSSGPLGDIVGDVSVAAAALPGAMAGVGGIVGDVESRVAILLDQAGSLLAELETIAGNLAATTEAVRDPTGLVTTLLDPSGSIKTFLDDDDALYKKVMSIVGEADKAVRSLQGIITGLNGEMPKIAGLLNETKAAIKQAQDVLEGVKNNPLIRGGVTERVEQESLYSAMREGSFE
ncbi:MAG TPA: MlaD family protein [Spirochaetales bacterium]|nr:MlaD family protein [Spirochaetales bacterium]HPB65019.1 MlaD family protein [Spirochaetales bacterium]HPM71563.1 MlaD family protein [Spirochaetales bacterium]HQO65756.1 MlaD family protein [Spirochaetales bacterium]